MEIAGVTMKGAKASQLKASVPRDIGDQFVAAEPLVHRVPDANLSRQHLG